MSRLISLTMFLLFTSSVLAATRSVRTAAELDAAAANAVAGDEIVLQPGTYQLTRTVALTKSNLVVRGATGQREDVVLLGGGMNTRGVDEGISINAIGITIRNLTVADFYFNGIHARAELEVDRCTMSNVKTLNIGERHIKGSRDPNSQTKMSDDFIIERVWLVQTKPRSGHPDTSPDYIGGIDMMAMNNLIIRDCRADGIVGSANGGNAAIFLWQGIRNVLIERNQIVGCAKGIALGNPSPLAANPPPQGHGIVTERSFATTWSSEALGPPAIILDSKWHRREMSSAPITPFTVRRRTISVASLLANRLPAKSKELPSNTISSEVGFLASLFGSRTCGYRAAISWATLTTFLGSVAAIFLAQALLKKFSGKGLVPDALTVSPQFLLTVALGAGGTVMLATLLGFPISTTHRLMGALVGAGVVAAGTQV